MSAQPIPEAKAPGRPLLLPALTSLRFFAALHVVFFHFAFVSPRIDNSQYDVWWRSALFSALDVGYVAVSFFFILSGFILAYTYLPKAAEGRLNPKEFWIARFARIYPAYLFSLIPGSHILIPLAKSTGVLAALGLVALKLGMLHAWTPFTARNWNDATWSLSVEALFYLSFPLAAIYILKLKQRALIPAAAAMFLFSSAVCLARYVLMRQFEATGPHVLTNYQYAQDLETIFARIPLLRLPEFLMGVVLGRVFLIKDKRMSRANAWFFISGLAILGILCVSRSIPDAFLESSVLVPPMALFVYAAAASEGWVLRALSLPWLLLLGEASYSLYLMHGPVAGLFRLTGAPFETGLPLIAYVIAAIATSLLVYRFIEVPSRRWIRARFTKAPARAVGE